MKSKMTEIDLAAKVIEWLKDQKWEIYQEVSLGYANAVVDIVALRDGVTWAIETKLSLSLALLEQAHNLIWYSNYVSIAIPPRRNVKGHKIAGIMMNQLGIGEIIVSDQARERGRAKLRRIKEIYSIKRFLNDAQKDYAPAGNSNRLYWSAFKYTSQQVKEFVSKYPGATLKEIVDGIKHHYSSSVTARSSVAKWIETGVIEGLYVRRDGKKITIWEHDQAPEARPDNAGEQKTLW